MSDDPSITLREHQTYAHVYVDMPQEMAFADVQIKADDEGIVVDIFDAKGVGIATTYAFYGEVFYERPN